MREILLSPSSLTQGSLLHPAEFTGMGSSPEEPLKTSAINSGGQKNLPVPLHAQSASSTSERIHLLPHHPDPGCIQLLCPPCMCPVPGTTHRAQVSSRQHPLQPCTGLCDSPQPTCLGLNPGSWQQQPAELASSTDTEVLQSLYLAHHQAPRTLVIVPRGSDWPPSGDSNSSR